MRRSGCEGRTVIEDEFRLVRASSIALVKGVRLFPERENLLFHRRKIGARLNAFEDGGIRVRRAVFILIRRAHLGSLLGACTPMIRGSTGGVAGVWRQTVGGSITRRGFEPPIHAIRGRLLDFCP